MAETYAQRKAAVITALRQTRRAYRMADTAGERLERNLDRLILRKTLITPDSLVKAMDEYAEYAGKVSAIGIPFTNTALIARSYV